MLNPGDWVEVLSAAEVLSTLDSSTALEALPFMPEMLACCGKAYQVQVRADRTCVRALPPGELEAIRALQDCVVLARLRCDGAQHGGCQLGCMFFWKERWLRKIEGPPPQREQPPRASEIALPSNRNSDPSVFFCQATELGKATRKSHSKWNPLGYARLVRAGTFTIPGVVRMLSSAGSHKVELAIRSRLSSSRPLGQIPAGEVLGLQPGEWIEIKSTKEVLATLDGRRCNKGLTFSNDMFGFCGLRLPVQSRVHTILDEATGRIRTIHNTVTLTGADCRKYLGCARQMPLLWREVWLKRVPTLLP